MFYDCRLSWFSIPISVLLVSFCLSRSLDAQTTDVEQRLEEIRAKMMKARAKLKTGSFKAVGTETHYRAEKDEEVTLVIQSHDIFDRPGKRQRYHYFRKVKLSTIPFMQQTQQNLDAMRERAFKAKRRNPDWRYQMVRCPDYMAEWMGNGTPGETQLSQTQLALRDPDAKPGIPLVGPLDPASVGFFDHLDFRSGMTLEGIWEKLTSQTEKVEIRTTANQLMEITFRYQHMIRKIHIDAANGYTVRRVEVYGLDAEGNPLEKPVKIGEASWKLVNEVWVPTQYSVRSDRANGDYGKTEFKLYWETVNPDPKTFDDDLFTYDSFDGLWEGTRVYDARGGFPPIHMGKVDSQGQIIYGPLNGGVFEPKQ